MIIRNHYVWSNLLSFHCVILLFILSYRATEHSNCYCASMGLFLQNLLQGFLEISHDFLSCVDGYDSFHMCVSFLLSLLPKLLEFELFVVPSYHTA